MADDPASAFEAFVRENDAGTLTVWVGGLRFDVDVADIAEVRRGVATAPDGWAAVRLRLGDHVTVTALGGAPDPAEFVTGAGPFAFRTRERWPPAEPNAAYDDLERAYRRRHGLDWPA